MSQKRIFTLTPLQHIEYFTLILLQIEIFLRLYPYILFFISGYSLNILFALSLSLSLSALFLFLTPSPSSTHSLLIPKPFLEPNVTAIDGCLDLDLFQGGGFDRCTRRFPVEMFGPKMGIRCLRV